MLSGELARLSGVTVRALRHYHQIGLLPDAARTGNGYRQYDVHDLVRVLRIKRLAAVGIPLERMPALLDDLADDATDQLDALDRELAEQVDRLVAQRELIARLREHRAAPDVPPELAPFLRLFSTDLSSDMARFDRDQTVLLAHLAGSDGLAQMVKLYERLSQPDVAPAMLALAGRFERLGPQSTAVEVSTIVDDFVTTVSPALEHFTAASEDVDLGLSSAYFDEHAIDRLNETQRLVLRHLEQRMG